MDIYPFQVDLPNSQPDHSRSPLLITLDSMNSTNNNLTAATADAIIHEYYANYIFNALLFSSTILPFYTALLRLSQEIEHIWFKPFSLPTWLYIFARYSILAQQGLDVAFTFVLSERACNIIAIITECVQTLGSIGIQGLLIARAYALCQSKIPTFALAFGFFAGLILRLSVIIAFPGCLPNNPTSDVIVALSANICGILTEFLVFGICMWKVWGTWKLKREAGIQSTHSLVSVLIRQSILRCCFVVVINIISEVLTEFENSSDIFQTVSQGFASYQNILSSILIADSTLDLRSLNSAKIGARNTSLPPLQFSNVLQHVHQSITVELATPDPENINVEGDHDNPGFESMEDSDIQPAQD